MTSNKKIEQYRFVSLSCWKSLYKYQVSFQGQLEFKSRQLYKHKSMFQQGQEAHNIVALHRQYPTLESHK